MPSTTIEVRGAEDSILRIRADRDRLIDDVQNALIHATRIGEHVMKAEVDRYSGRTAASIRVGGLIYSPGGPGGGGFYEVELVAGEGIPYFNIYVEGRSMIKAGPHFSQKVRPEWLQRKGAKRMVFASPRVPGGLAFATSVAGYDGRTAWITNAQMAAREAMEGFIRRIDARSAIG